MKDTSGQFNYYFIESGIISRVPLLKNDDKVDPEGIDFLYNEETVADDYVAHLRAGMPFASPNMNVDILFLEGFYVFSGRVREALMKHMPIKCLQLVEAKIRWKKKIFDNFWIANVHQTLRAFDEKQSDFRKKNRDDEWVGTKRIVLDKALLSRIPLEERLAFEAKEDCQFILYHESVVEIIRSLNLVGMQFIPVEEWRDSSCFREALTGLKEHSGRSKFNAGG